MLAEEDETQGFSSLKGKWFFRCRSVQTDKQVQLLRQSHNPIIGFQLLSGRYAPFELALQAPLVPHFTLDYQQLVTSSFSNPHPDTDRWVRYRALTDSATKAEGLTASLQLPTLPYCLIPPYRLSMLVSTWPYIPHASHSSNTCSNSPGRSLPQFQSTFISCSAILLQSVITGSVNSRW